jgi:CBS domain containing-hemolysin-like protein
VAAALPGQYTVAIASGALTVAILLLSEILPKTLGAAYWKQLGPSAVVILTWMVNFMAPFIALILMLKKLMPLPDSHVITRDELAVLADIGEEEGAIERDEETVIMNLLNLRNIAVSEIMTPRVVISALPEAFTVRQALDQSPPTHFSRIPLYGDSIDDLRGFVLRSDILLAASNGEWDQSLIDFKQTPLTINLDQSVETLFDRLRKTNSHLAFVWDEFGGTAGLVSLEDVIETLLGVEIVDERDEVADMRELAKRRAEDKASEPPQNL